MDFATTRQEWGGHTWTVHIILYDSDVGGGWWSGETHE